MTHRFIRKDDLSTGKTFTVEMMAGDAARVYSAEHLTLLSMGHTILIGDVLHCDLNAHLEHTRQLPEAMLRKPQAGPAAPDCAIPTVATDDDALADALAILPGDRRKLDRVILGLH